MALANTIARAAKRGVLCVIETHSSLLLLGVQRLVAEGKVDAKDVSLNWFSKDKQSGQTRIEQASVEADGSVGQWPVDFDEVMMDAQMAFLNASSKG